MKTVLEIAQDLAPHCGLAVPTALAASADQEYVDLKSCMNAAGNELQARFDWPELRKTATLTSLGNVPIPVPFDYSRPVRGWSIAASGQPVRGSLSDEEFNRLAPVAGVPRYFRSSSERIEFWPYLNAGETIPLVYVSTNWLSGDFAEINTDAVSPLFNDRLLHQGALWRFKRMKGQDFKDWLDEFEASLKTYSSFARPGRVV